MLIPDSPAERLDRAKGYPFGHPDRSYLFRAGGPEPLDDVATRIRGRVPVIASGSNAAPDQLARKFAGLEVPVEVPVTRVVLADFDSVYNAHITSYGSVSATLHPSPGTRLTTFITWLAEAELEVMHATEQPGVNYHYSRLTGIAAEADGIGAMDTVFAYISVVGCLAHEGDPVSLAEVPAEGRRFKAVAQTEVLALVRDRTAPGADLDSFILEHIADETVRHGRSRSLAEDARPFAHDGHEIIQLGGR
jgi:hypothetical protein